MTETKDRIQAFINYAKLLSGDEKSEAQVFLDRLFQGFGHDGYKEAGATLESRVKANKKNTRFVDLLWAPRVLIEMKKRGEKLARHYDQARDYWHDTYPKPQYVVLCNFDEIWIYDFFYQSDPVDTLRIEELLDRHLSLAFLFPEIIKPQFGNDREAVSREAADLVAQVFNSLITRGENRENAQRFILQCVFCMFAEDFDLLPHGLFTQMIDDCINGTGNSYDLFLALFNQMNSTKPAIAGRFKNVEYFNGGLFETIVSIELQNSELQMLGDAAKMNWSKVQPPIFGALFEGSMGKEERHAFGAHFTSEVDIKKIVRPTIERPWMKRIDAAKTLKELRKLRDDLLQFRVLDPACGCGNFLYVAYREMRRLEMRILTRIHQEFGKKARAEEGTRPLLSLKQFHGIDINGFAVELAKVTLMLAREQGIEETRKALDNGELELMLELEPPLPLDNLDDNIVKADALFTDWPDADAIIGNPPYQSKNKMQREFGPEYVGRVRANYPEVPGRADYCVYWFRRAHDELDPGKRAGLVGTNTIRQNYSREGGLDYIVANDGTITEAVSTQVWSGEAVVHVSIVNWVKGVQGGRKRLHRQIGDDRDSRWHVNELPEINSSLSTEVDLSGANRLTCNMGDGFCYQGQTHGNKGFLLPRGEAEDMIHTNPELGDVLFPYLTADEMLTGQDSLPKRYVIDFHPRSVIESRGFADLFKRIEALVLPHRESSAEKERKRNEKAQEANPKARVNRHHGNFLKRWWHLSYPRKGLMSTISTVHRYVACGQVTKRPIFEFVSSSIHPNAALQVFPLPDDFSFGILQSSAHWEWFKARCSTLKGDFRYTSDSVFDTFPWPQTPTLAKVKAVAKASVDLRTLRRQIMADNGMSLRDLYRTLDLPGANPLKDAQEKLDAAVRAAYGMKKKEDVLTFLLALNQDVAAREANGETVTAPGLPPCVKNPRDFITKDCIEMPEGEDTT